VKKVELISAGLITRERYKLIRDSTRFYSAPFISALNKNRLIVFLRIATCTVLCLSPVFVIRKKKSRGIKERRGRSTGKG
jgi:hypothetical protein